MDVHSPEQRSHNMSCVKSAGTRPEIAVRRIISAMGYRYRLNRKDLPGKPDLAFVGRRKVIFVHGCFWHSHTCRKGKKDPRTNVAFWKAKRAENRIRDRMTLKRLCGAGWKVLVVWECQITERSLPQKIASFLEKHDKRA